VLQGARYTGESGSPHVTLGSCLNRGVGASLSPLAVRQGQLEQARSQHGCVNGRLKAGGRTRAEPLMGMLGGKSLAFNRLLHGGGCVALQRSGLLSKCPASQSAALPLRPRSYKWRRTILRCLSRFNHRGKAEVPANVQPNLSAQRVGEGIKLKSQ